MWGRKGLIVLKIEIEKTRKRMVIKRTKKVNDFGRGMTN